MRSIKKAAFLLLFSLGLIFWGSAQQSGAGPIDLILLLDTSSSMSASYGEVSDYITGPFLREFLRIGDTFHLISFSEKPRVEIARRIEGRGEVETIIGRMLLMYPLDPWSDIPGALAYAEKYSGSLPPSRPKKIVLISDGDVSPAPGSGSALDPAGLQTLISDIKTRLGPQGISLDYVTVPLVNLPVSGRTPLPGASVRVTQGPAPVVPAQAGTAAAPVTPPAQQTAPVQTPAAPAAAPSDTVTQPAPAAEPAAVLPLASAPAAETPAQPPAPPAQPSPVPSASSQGEKAAQEPSVPNQLPVPLIGLGILALALIGGGIFFITRRSKDSPKRVKAPRPSAAPSSSDAAKASAPAPRQAPVSPAPRPQAVRPSAQPVQAKTQTLAPVRRPAPFDDQYKAPPVPTDGRPLMLKLFVGDQNTFIGKRNIHLVKQGFTFTIGGGKSDFLIFLVPMPPRIAELRYEDCHFILIPLKARYFPDIGDKPVRDCIGKTIRIISDKDFELHMRIELYEDPLINLNKLLRSVSVPG
ncbi:hypothetical protein FACS1894106_2300 [Spirochaetia bacterium]|nr:hypothetical protein FACS1894106_2300 [Spirochaetia bacterium]